MNELTKSPDGVQPVRVLHAMQLNAALMPFSPFALCPQPLLRRPTDVVHDPRDRPRAAVLHEVDALLEGGESRNADVSVLWECGEAENSFCDEGEGAFRADDKVCEVVACGSFARPIVCLDYSAVCYDTG